MGRTVGSGGLEERPSEVTHADEAAAQVNAFVHGLSGSCVLVRVVRLEQLRNTVYVRAS